MISPPYLRGDFNSVSVGYASTPKCVHTCNEKQSSRCRPATCLFKKNTLYRRRQRSCTRVPQSAERAVRFVLGFAPEWRRGKHGSFMPHLLSNQWQIYGPSLQPLSLVALALLLSLRFPPASRLRLPPFPPPAPARAQPAPL